MKLTSKVFHEDGSTPKLSRRKRKPLKRRVKKNIRKKMRWSKEAGDGHGSYSDCHYQLMFEITIWWKKNLTITMYYYVFYVLLSGMDLPFCFGGLRMTGFGTSFPDQFPPICISLIWMCYYIMYYNCIIYILAWFKTYEFIYGASPAAGCAARARKHLCASNDRRAHVLNARAPACARFQQEMLHMF